MVQSFAIFLDHFVIILGGSNYVRYEWEISKKNVSSFFNPIHVQYVPSKLNKIKNSKFALCYGWEKAGLDRGR